MLLVCLQVAQTVQRGGPRSQIAIPAQGLIEFRDALTDLLDEFGTDDHGMFVTMPDNFVAVIFVNKMYMKHSSIQDTSFMLIN